MRRFQVLLRTGAGHHPRRRRTGNVSFDAGTQSRDSEAAIAVGSARWVCLGGAVPDVVHAGVHVSHVGWVQGRGKR